mmetsp:Transcript_7139/g.20156  ORF Transcript_7139/g.20156 Transcript_7139/m.20156 type:complete len:513 (+) Transcript_7139:1000-2538(+)|eukprot:CAMPEP_0117689000 /NCGR_PEP_ID=MMETSP0804-20121206/24201_1 /TAXON_ID=1074897 /ORGANISM="Tetraselmis astigmatica, Strain CCMP880" /LENGTH=512 /DNA_ID=CAMNT_0005501633 /DNA_START=899 /DNA_END=2437 /DNA_ORIENTATION=+
MVDREFETRRLNALHELYGSSSDRSRKGSVDAPIQELVDCINDHPHMFTTSCCSGRISCFAEPTAETRAAGRKGGEWIYASHDKADPEEIVSAISTAAPGGGCLVFRMEPFVMHAECRGVEWSAQLLGLARQAGFRESGMVPSNKGRCMVGIRCNLRLEVPVADAGEMLVSEHYLRYLTASANRKFELNSGRHKKFLDLVQRVALELMNPVKSKGRAMMPGVDGLQRRASPARRGETTDGNPAVPPAVCVVTLDQRAAVLLFRQKAVLKRLAAIEATAIASDVVVSLTPPAEAGEQKKADGEAAARPTAGDAFERNHSKPRLLSSSITEVAGWMIVLPKARVKQVKDAVKTAGWLDASRKSSAVGSCVKLPVMPECAEAIQGKDRSLPSSIRMHLSSSSLEWGKLPLNSKKPISPLESMRESVQALLQSVGGISQKEQVALLRDLPSRWERMGDLVLLPASACTGPKWKMVPEVDLWAAIASGLGATRLARQAAVASTGTRLVSANAHLCTT